MNPFKNVFGRNPSEEHRSATPLELFFDLVYVVAIASAATGLHHKLLEHHVIDGIGWYMFAFFVIWLCWINFTWYASAFDPNDTIFRILSFVQIFGALVLAVGISNFFDTNPDLILGLIGYIIMRIAMVLNWIRAGMSSSKYRAVSYRYAIGISIAQILWVLAYFFGGSYFIPIACVLIVIELLIPIISERNFAEEGTPWHPDHIAERYGLLVIIVLGEGILATTNTISSLVTVETKWEDAFPLGFAAAGLIFSLWWSYFKMPFGQILDKKKSSLVLSLLYGYGHYFIFASLAAAGVGLQLVADAASAQDGSEHSVSAIYALTCTSIAVAIYLFFMNIYDVLYTINKRSWQKWLIGMFLPFLPVLVYYLGIDLPWALWFSVVAPILYILVGKRQGSYIVHEQKWEM